MNMNILRQYTMNNKTNDYDNASFPLKCDDEDIDTSGIRFYEFPLRLCEYI